MSHIISRTGLICMKGNMMGATKKRCKVSVVLMMLFALAMPIMMVGCASNSTCGDAYHSAIAACDANDPNNPECYSQATNNYLACMNTCSDCGSSCGDKFYSDRVACYEGPCMNDPNCQACLDCYTNAETAYQQCAASGGGGGSGGNSWLVLIATLWGVSVAELQGVLDVIGGFLLIDWLEDIFGLS